jgi:hypothetical protein
VLAAGAAALALSGAARPAAVAEETWEGRYGLDVRVAAVARVPFFGDEPSVTRTVMLIDVRRTDAGMVQRQRVCHVSTASPRMRTTIPAAFVDALPVREYPGIFPDAAGDRYFADTGVESIGFDPAATAGLLPRGASDRGVVDSDGDGNPGATVVGHFPLFGAVRLYLVQRSHVTLEGRRTAPGRVEGTVHVRLMEQRTIGASNRLFRRNVTVRPDPERSGFTLLRVPAGTDCAELARRRDELFPGG